ncbi:MAG: sigma-70 family RNA polymerase sigma factor [Bryobacteraceae bacterium]
MLSFQRGSGDALEELFARFREPLYGFFRRRLANGQRAEDLTQETFVAVIQGSARYEPRARVKTYLYGIALNLLATERRKQAKQCIAEMLREPSVTTSSDSEIWFATRFKSLVQPSGRS